MSFAHFFGSHNPLIINLYTVFTQEKLILNDKSTHLRDDPVGIEVEQGVTPP